MYSDSCIAFEHTHQIDSMIVFLKGELKTVQHMTYKLTLTTISKGTRFGFSNYIGKAIVFNKLVLHSYNTFVEITTLACK